MIADLNLVSWSRADVYLFCFIVGGLWSLVSLLGAGIGGAHSHGGHLHFSHAHLSHGHGHAGSHAHHSSAWNSWLGGLMHPSSVAIFLAWFGGAGYLLDRHTGWTLALEVAAAAGLGLAGALVFASFLRWLQSREKPLDPADYQMAGILGRVSATIRPDGVGELIYQRNGARTPLPARSEGGVPIARGEEVVVTRYERGIAYVRAFHDVPVTDAEARPSR
jgi:membrane protein implicated in regulation of membrane protease activity